MKSIYLKNNKTITPILFSISELQDKKVINILGNQLPGFHTYLLLPCMISTIGTYIDCRLERSRSLHRFSTFRGGIVVNDNIICLLVYIQRTQQFVILEEEFTVKYPTACTVLKKNLRAEGILTRKNLVISKREEIEYNFIVKLQPSVESFMIETQVEMSKKFISKVKENLITI